MENNNWIDVRICISPRDLETIKSDADIDNLINLQMLATKHALKEEIKKRLAQENN